MSDSILVVGGAEYIGSHVIQAFLAANAISALYWIYQNISLGKSLSYRS